jgi:hypothetical protein
MKVTSFVSPKKKKKAHKKPSEQPGSAPRGADFIHQYYWLLGLVKALASISTTFLGNTIAHAYLIVHNVGQGRTISFLFFFIYLFILAQEEHRSTALKEKRNIHRDPKGTEKEAKGGAQFRNDVHGGTVTWSTRLGGCLP